MHPRSLIRTFAVRLQVHLTLENVQWREQMSLWIWICGVWAFRLVTLINNSPKFSIKALQYSLLDFDKGNGQLIFYVWLAGRGYNPFPLSVIQLADDVTGHAVLPSFLLCYWFRTGHRNHCHTTHVGSNWHVYNETKRPHWSFWAYFPRTVTVAL